MSVLPRIVKLNKKDECSDEAAISLVLILRSYSVGKCSITPQQGSKVWTSSLPATPNHAHETINIQVKKLYTNRWVSSRVLLISFF